MGDSSQAQLMVKDQEPIAALEGMEMMAEAKSMKPQAKCILGGQVLQVRVHVQVHIHGYTLGTGEVPEKDNTAGTCARTRTWTRTGTRTRVHFK
jgi:hypothetical protein